MAETQVPTLDARDFLSGDASRKARFVADLLRAYTDIGFVVVRGHAVSEDLQKRAYSVIGDFFHLPTERKRTYEVHGTGGARGYTSFGKEHAKDSKHGDLKEFFHVGMEVPKDHALAGQYPPNVLVPDVPHFDTTLRLLYSGLLDLGIEMLRAIALGLELPENYFDEKVRHGNSILRPIHYPAMTGKEEPGAVRSGAHEDINLITLLIGASSPGLEVKNKRGDWVSIVTEPHEIVVNVGDMPQRLTNHRLKSTTHRVVNPPPAAKNPTRYSIPFFLHPVSDMSLAALPSCMKAGETPREPPILAGDYLEQRLREIGLL